MTLIETMMDEHQNILKMIEVMRSAMKRFMETDHIEKDDIMSMFEFVKEYADQHHHGKEEIILFDEMITHIGPTADKLITHGMLVEHDLGRLYVSNTLTALKDYLNGQSERKIDVISNAISYGELLKRHIDKEDRVVFPLASRELPKHVLDNLNQKSEAFEIEHHKRKEHYLHILENLSSKY